MDPVIEQYPELVKYAVDDKLPGIPKQPGLSGGAFKGDATQSMAPAIPAATDPAKGFKPPKPVVAAAPQPTSPRPTPPAQATPPQTAQRSVLQSAPTWSGREWVAPTAEQMADPSHPQIFAGSNPEQNPHRFDGMRTTLGPMAMPAHVAAQSAPAYATPIAQRRYEITGTTGPARPREEPVAQSPAARTPAQQLAGMQRMSERLSRGAGMVPGNYGGNAAQPAAAKPSLWRTMSNNAGKMSRGLLYGGATLAASPAIMAAKARNAMAERFPNLASSMPGSEIANSVSQYVGGLGDVGIGAARDAYGSLMSGGTTDASGMTPADRAAYSNVDAARQRGYASVGMTPENMSQDEFTRGLHTVGEASASTGERAWDLAQMAAGGRGAMRYTTPVDILQQGMQYAPATSTGASYAGGQKQGQLLKVNGMNPLQQSIDTTTIMRKKKPKKTSLRKMQSLYAGLPNPTTEPVKIAAPTYDALRKYAAGIPEVPSIGGGGFTGAQAGKPPGGGAPASGFEPPVAGVPGVQPTQPATPAPQMTPREVTMAPGYDRSQHQARQQYLAAYPGSPTATAHQEAGQRYLAAHPQPVAPTAVPGMNDDMDSLMTRFQAAAPGSEERLQLMDEYDRLQQQPAAAPPAAPPQPAVPPIAPPPLAPPAVPPTAIDASMNADPQALKEWTARNLMGTPPAEPVAGPAGYDMKMDAANPAYQSEAERAQAAQAEYQRGLAETAEGRQQEAIRTDDARGATADVQRRWEMQNPGELYPTPRQQALWQASGQDPGQVPSQEWYQRHWDPQRDMDHLRRNSQWGAGQPGHWANNFPEPEQPYDWSEVDRAMEAGREINPAALSSTPLSTPISERARKGYKITGTAPLGSMRVRPEMPGWADRMMAPVADATKPFLVEQQQPGVERTEVGPQGQPMPPRMTEPPLPAKVKPPARMPSRTAPPGTNLVDGGLDPVTGERYDVPQKPKPGYVADGVDTVTGEGKYQEASKPYMAGGFNPATGEGQFSTEKPKGSGYAAGGIDTTTGEPAIAPPSPTEPAKKPMPSNRIAGGMWDAVTGMLAGSGRKPSAAAAPASPAPVPPVEDNSWQGRYESQIANARRTGNAREVRRLELMQSRKPNQANKERAKAVTEQALADAAGSRAELPARGGMQIRNVRDQKLPTRTPQAERQSFVDQMAGSRTRPDGMPFLAETENTTRDAIGAGWDDAMKRVNPYKHDSARFARQKVGSDYGVLRTFVKESGNTWWGAFKDSFAPWDMLDNVDRFSHGVANTAVSGGTALSGMLPLYQVPGLRSAGKSMRNDGMKSMRAGLQDIGDSLGLTTTGLTPGLETKRPNQVLKGPSASSQAHTDIINKHFTPEMQALAPDQRVAANIAQLGSNTGLEAASWVLPVKILRGLRGAKSPLVSGPSKPLSALTDFGGLSPLFNLLNLSDVQKPQGAAAAGINETIDVANNDKVNTALAELQRQDIDEGIAAGRQSDRDSMAGLLEITPEELTKHLEEQGVKQQRTREAGAPMVEPSHSMRSAKSRAVTSDKATTDKPALIKFLEGNVGPNRDPFDATTTMGDTLKRVGGKVVDPYKQVLKNLGERKPSGGSSTAPATTSSVTPAAATSTTSSMSPTVASAKASPKMKELALKYGIPAGLLVGLTALAARNTSKKRKAKKEKQAAVWNLGDQRPANSNAKIVPGTVANGGIQSFGDDAWESLSNYTNSVVKRQQQPEEPDEDKQAAFIEGCRKRGWDVERTAAFIHQGGKFVGV